MSLSQRIVSKEWNVRLGAYDELIVLFNEGSPDIPKYVPSLKKIIVDPYPPVKEKAMDALLTFISSVNFHYMVPPSFSGDVSGILIDKCLAGRDSVKNKAVEALLLLIETCPKDSDSVVTELCKNCVTHKVPKIAAMCVFTLREAVMQFGVPAIPAESILPILEQCFEHSFKDVRTEAFSLCVELYRWLGVSLRSHLKNLRPTQLRDLDAAFELLPPDTRASVTPVRFIKKPPPNPVGGGGGAAVAAAAAGGGGASPAVSSAKPEKKQHTPLQQPSVSVLPKPQVAVVDEGHTDPSEAEPVDLMTMLSSDWFKNLDAGSWHERKAQVDQLLVFCPMNTPLKMGVDYSRLTAALMRISNDPNISVQQSILKVVEMLTLGLCADFAVHAKRLAPFLVEKLKERMLVTSIQNILDLFLATSCLSLSDITDCIPILFLATYYPAFLANSGGVGEGEVVEGGPGRGGRGRGRGGKKGGNEIRCYY